MSQRFSNKFLPVWVSLSIAFGILLGFTFLRDKTNLGPLEFQLKEIISLVEENYVEEIPSEILIENALVGISRGFPGQRLVSKQRLGKSLKLRDYGVVVFPLESGYRILNIFPGSFPGILGFNVGDRLNNLEFLENGIRFLWESQNNRRQNSVFVPDSFAVFTSRVLEMKRESEQKLVCLSPTLDEFQNYLAENDEVDHSILDLRFFSNVDQIRDPSVINEASFDSVLTGPFTFGIGEIINRRFEKGSEIPTVDFETDNYALVSSGGIPFPSSESGKAENESKYSLQKTIETFLNEMDLVSTLDLNGKDLFGLSPFEHYSLFAQIKKGGLEATYNRIL